MLIHAYGLFWRRDEVEWEPGKGNAGVFRLLGHHGKIKPKLRVVDFRDQVGLYVLYNPYGPHYVGLTRAQGLGKRLRDHHLDARKGDWDRFSWFGFRKVLQRTDSLGLRVLAALGEVGVGSTSTTIGEMEALLIKAMGCAQNTNAMSFKKADEWTQVRWDDVEEFIEKVAP